MKSVLILAAVLCAVSTRQLLNEDEVLDELNYRSKVRHKRALCGSDIPVPTPDPSCRHCHCNIIFKRSIVSPQGGPGFWPRPRPIPGPVLCDYSRCCLMPVPYAAAGASASLSDASVNRMASNLIHSIGKRSASGDAKFKKASMDLVFLIDDSGSIPSSQFTIAKEGAAILSQALCPRDYGSGEGQKQVSVVLFGTTPKTVLTYEDSQNGAAHVDDTILGMRQRSGSTATVDAIKYVRENILTSHGNRLNDPDTATVVFVITDGKCNQRDCYKLGEESRLLRQAGEGVQVFAFGVGDADCDELEIIRGDDAGRVFGLPNFDFFEKLANAVKKQLEEDDSACVAEP